MHPAKSENATSKRAPRLGAALVGASVLFGSHAARATPDFPAVVVKTLGLPGVTIDPPQGCTLCHATDSGGTALRPFGTLILQDGAQPYAETTLEQALAQVGKDEPGLIADIQAGKDPNDDQAATTLPTPQYGCAAARGTPGGASIVWASILATLAFVRRRRR